MDNGIPWISGSLVVCRELHPKSPDVVLIEN